jgi:hypothetical protein
MQNIARMRAAANSARNPHTLSSAVFGLLLILVLSPAVLAADTEVTDPDVDQAIHGYLQEDMPVIAAARGGLFGFASIQVNAWYAQLDGDIKTGTKTTALKESEFVGLPVVTFNIGGFGGRFDGFLSKFNDSTSEVKIDQLRALFLWSFFNTNTISLSLEAGLVGTAVDVSITGTSSSEEFVLPALGILFEAKLLTFMFEVELTGATLGSGETVLDFRASAAFSLFFFNGRLGYRILDFDLDKNGTGLDGNLGGFYAGIGFQF